MNLHELSPAAGSTTKSFRKGRGHGSGNGKTAGRGHKGQWARSGPDSNAKSVPQRISNKILVYNGTLRSAFKYSGRQLRDELYIYKANTILHQPIVLFACFIYLIPFTVFAGLS